MIMVVRVFDNLSSLHFSHLCRWSGGVGRGLHFAVILESSGRGLVRCDLGFLVSRGNRFGDFALYQRKCLCQQGLSPENRKS
jgi:hypothetical protein